MDIKIVPAEEKKNEREYPYVGITDAGDSVVIFDGHYAGMALEHSGGIHYSEGWAEYKFRPFHGTITITCP